MTGRSLEEEADADRGRVLFSAPFRRLQNKAQVFSLETNAAVRSRLTHSLEVSSIGRLVAQHALQGFTEDERRALGIWPEERAFTTFVETACLIHDLGNPPFGHFGELAISDWFFLHKRELVPTGIGGALELLWGAHYADFASFDGNPQGFRICSRLQPQQTEDLYGMNLTGTTLAAALKYPWTANDLAEKPGVHGARKKAGFFTTESDVLAWMSDDGFVRPQRRHPLVYLVEAADDIAYCVSDIEDGIEKGLVSAVEFAGFVEGMMEQSAEWKATTESVAGESEDRKDVAGILSALDCLKDPWIARQDGVKVRRLTAIQDFRSAVIRLLARQAGNQFIANHGAILEGEPIALLESGGGVPILEALKAFARKYLYSSTIVRNRELTAQAVLCGLLDAYLPVMTADLQARFDFIERGKQKDRDDRPIARESSLFGRLSPKYLEVYREEVATLRKQNTEEGKLRVMERVHRIRLIVDHISGMTDEFALQSYHLVSGVQVNPYRQ